MRAAVYRLRERGVRLPRPKAAVHGELVLGVVDRGDRKVFKAQLQRDGRDILPPLVDVQVTRITRHGMVLKGREMESRVPGSSKARIETHSQTWWALIHTPEFLEDHESLDPLEDADDRAFVGVFGPSDAAVPPGTRPAWQVRNGPAGSG